MSDKIIHINRKNKKRSKNDNNLQSDHYVFDSLCREDTLFKGLYDYRVYFDSEGRGGLFKITEGDVAKRVQPGNVSSEFYAWYNREIGKDDEDKMSLNFVDQGVKAWTKFNNPTYNCGILKDFPVNVRFKSQPGITFTRLPYDPMVPDDVEEKCPVFCSMLKRLGNREAFVKKVGGFFDPDGYRKQSIWLWGPTNGGKSVIQQLISKMMGGESNRAILTPTEMKGTFWKELLVGKALWMVQEADAKFLSTSMYKGLTGDSDHVVNPKGESLYSVKLEGHMLFASNEEPTVKKDDAVIDRVIPVHVAAVPKKDILDEKELWKKLDEEIPYIVGYCIDEYEKGGCKKIECDKKDIYNAMDNEDWDLQAIFDTHFEADETINYGTCEVELSQFYNVIGFKGKRAAKGTIAYDMKEFIDKKYNSKVVVAKRKDGKAARMLNNIKWRYMRPGEDREW